MIRISPKVIDVEGNRVGSDKIETIRNIDNKLQTASYEIVDYGMKKYYKESVGRFPTQLFTNIKNDKYKYVKNIT